MKHLRSLWILLTTVLFSLTLMAQEFRATISGRVVDSSGAAIAGAAVKVVNDGTQETNTVNTDETGTYNVPFLRPGTYTVTVSNAGFKTAVRSGVVLQVSQKLGLDVPLEVGQVTDSVTVEAYAATIDTQTASRSGVIDNKSITECH